MLTTLHVENFALIDTLDLDFSPGLTVLTGETGAGKSILVDSINAILGERTGVDVIRSGESRAVIQGAFDIDLTGGVAEALSDNDLETEDGQIIVSREINLQGKSQSRLNGRLVNLGQQKAISQFLADVHGQHEHQLLLSPSWQLQFLDGYAGQEALDLKRKMSARFKLLSQKRSQIASLSTDERERERLRGLYSYQVREIDAAELVDGEEQELKSEAIRLANQEKLFLAVNNALADLNGTDAGESGAVSHLQSAIKSLDAVVKIDSELASVAESINETIIQLDDSLGRLQSWAETIDIRPERIDEVQGRLDLINSLRRKYGETITEILAYREEVQTALNTLENSDEMRRHLESEIADLEQETTEIAGKLSELRVSASVSLKAKVESELNDLGMTGSLFEAAVQSCDKNSSGADRVDFLISANAGEAMRPLAKVASGGEASRIMLALKTVLTSGDPVETLVFDEVDAGIGGRTATVVGEKLKALSETKQVFCVTHLAQIARFADHHLYVEKHESTGRTSVTISKLTPEMRVRELARMLGGDIESETALQHARELLGANATA